VKSALWDTFEFGCFVLIIYEIGIIFLDPDWWTLQFTSLGGYPFSDVSNEDVMIISLLLIVAAFSIRNFRRIMYFFARPLHLEKTAD